MYFGKKIKKKKSQRIHAHIQYVGDTCTLLICFLEKCSEVALTNYTLFAFQETRTIMDNYT